jgi:hypothetical protein
VARIEGTGIATPSKKSMRLAGNLGPSTPVRIDTGIDINTGKPYKRVFQDFGAARVGEIRLKKAEADTTRPNFFSPGGGAFDERNNVQIASAGDSFDENDFQGYLKAAGIRYPKQLPGPMMRGLRENYQMDKKEGIYKDGQIFNRTDTLLNKAPVKEKPSFVEQTKNLAGSIFNAVTGTQPATASQIPGGMPTGTQFTSSNLDAAKAPTGDTSFASYRMAGQPSGGEQQQQGSGIVTPFSQTSMGKGEPRNVTKFQDTSMGRKTVTVDGQEVAKRQTVASLPSDYKQTEAREFAKAAAFQQAKKNPNVKAGVDSKGQPTVTAANDSGRARAQAAAINRKISGKSISQTKAANRASMRASAAARNASFQARKKAGKLSKSERTAKGQRAAKKAAAKKRAQAAAKARNARRRRSRRRGRRGRGR